jgi:hydrogenase expression/formation protein HypE
MRASRYGSDAAIIGEVESPDASALGDAAADAGTGAGAANRAMPRAFVRTAFGSTRVLDMLVGEQLPRIC